MIGNPRFHRGSYAPCVADAATVVLHEVERQRRDIVSRVFVRIDPSNPKTTS
jgi:hypothetical protein